MMIAGLVWHFIDSVAGSHIPPTHPGLNLSTRLPCFGQTWLAVLRLGMLATFLSHPVISGFITASALLIAASQLKHVLGVSAEGQTLLQQADAVAPYVGLDPGRLYFQ